MLKTKRILLALFSTIAFFASANTYTIESLANPQTSNSQNYICNPDDILDAETSSILNKQIISLNAKNGTEIAIVAVNSIGDNNIEEFANQLFSKWGIGKKNADNGLLILFVLDQKKIRFETGYGLEGALPDAICKRIQSQAMIPYFKNNDYNTGFIKGLELVVKRVQNEEFAFEESDDSTSYFFFLAKNTFFIISILSCLLVFYYIEKAKRETNLTSNIAKYKTAKADIDGMNMLLGLLLPFILIIIGFFLGIGVFMFVPLAMPVGLIPSFIISKILLVKLRRKNIPCTECDGTMHILSEKKEDVHLDMAQQLEEQLKTVDYDVFVCNKCANKAIYTLDKPSSYTKCPKCNTKAYLLTRKTTILPATYYNGGTEKHQYTCMYCKHKDDNFVNTPRVSRSSNAALMGGAAGGLLGGGGGFGSSSSGGSFGGGMSGGGGSTSSW